jgi:glycosyltransferase involved in cell wall biosynthesis
MTKAQIIIASFQSLTVTSAGGIGQLGYMLADKLYKHRLLREFVVSSKGKFSTEFPSSPVAAISRYYLFLINKLSSALKLAPYVSRYIQEYLYDVYCARHLNTAVEYFIVTTPYLYRSFVKAKRLGIRIYFIPGNPEDNYIAKLVHEENERYGIRKNDAYTYQKRLDYYNRSLPLVDHIIAHSGIIEETYNKAGYGDKLIKVHGYLKPAFRAAEKSNTGSSGKFTVAFLGYAVLLKGLQYLLEAWKDLQELDMELHIGGIVDDNVLEIIERDYKSLKNVYYHGEVRDVPAFMADKSLFVQPSLIDGGPVTVLEAMNTGLPVIVTENCGAKDIVEEGKSGWIVPIRNAEMIREKITEAFNDREKAARMGEHGKRSIESYNMDEFVSKVGSLFIKSETNSTS